MNEGPALSPAEPWVVRPYQRGDERQLVGLFQRVFGRAMSEAHWLWKLRRPSPVDNVWLALHDGKAIFQYAGIPTTFSLPSGPATIVVSVDTMTDPDFRRRGLLTQVGRDAYESWRTAGIPFVLGLPNEQWGSRAAALGWQMLFPMNWLARVIRPTALASRKLGGSKGGGLGAIDRAWNAAWQMLSRPDRAVTVERVRTAGAEFDRFWTDVEPRYRFSVRRDASWVTWRYLSPPDLRYIVLLASRQDNVCGWVAIRCPAPASSSTVGTIADLVVRPGDDGARAALIESAVRTLQAEGCEAVATLAPPGTSIDRALRRAGFFRRWGAFRVECVPLNAGLNLADMRDPSNWLIAGGDFDVV